MALTIIGANAQMADIAPQHYYKDNVPAGNYSGLTYLGHNMYAVVNDKATNDGFDIFHISIDSVTGEITNVDKMSTVTSSFAYQRDGEGIAYLPSKNTVFISGEADNKILEYTMNGNMTKRELVLPDWLVLPKGNYGLESLTYNAKTDRFWTTTESTLPQDGQQANATNGYRNNLRLLSFDGNLNYKGAIRYLMDAPISDRSAQIYAIGVTDLCALDDGRLLVLEREVRVPQGRIGSWVVNRIYSVDTKTEPLSTGKEMPANVAKKKLIAMWRTSFNLAHKDLANYEGMCVGPRLTDGRQVIVLCADSQNQKGHLLRDWFRTIVLN